MPCRTSTPSPRNPPGDVPVHLLALMLAAAAWSPAAQADESTLTLMREHK